MSKKPNIPLKYSALKEVIELYGRDTEDLIALLKEGTLKAEGRLYLFSDYPGEESSGHKPIDPDIWKDCKFDIERLVLQNQDDEWAYNDIRISREQLKESSNVSTRANSGRPPKHDLDAFWTEFCLEEARVSIWALPHLNQWVERCLSFELWKGDPPEKSTLKKRLRPLWRAMKNV